MEGFKRNKFYLSQLVNKYKPSLIFIQEHWLPHYDAEAKFSTNFPQYNFSVTSSDIFTPAEDKMLEDGPTWHGAAVGWDQNFDRNVSKIPIISERFSGVNFTDGQTNIIAYSAYLPLRNYQ